MPIIGKVFRVFYTMIHELGHALMAMITSGEIISISLFADTSGNTITKSKGKFEQFLIAIAGYPIAAVLVFVFFYLIHIEKTNMVLFIFAGIALVELVFWIRNIYGILWLVVFVVALLLVYRMEVALYSYAITIFFSSILLIESLISGIQLLYISIKTPKNAGDAGNLKIITYVPAVIWAILFLSITAFFIYLTAKVYFNL
ncbi:MAG: hypothetical protein AUJ97_04575 [Bacteroidetes bacterium CG2_30_32_10]|nr:MAG: hypothetical protein AUJ97_04575 [Bacteroidetes bacterium CG2_30_32_10]